MPHANVWIRRDDFEKWQGLPSKSEFISSALNGSTIKLVVKDEGTASERSQYVEEPEQLYSIAVKDSGITVKKHLTKNAADKWLELNNPNGELGVFPE